MKIIVENLGCLRWAEFELGDMTIICGENNTGKTYATYALYGFLSFWRDGFEIKNIDIDINRLLEEGSISIDIKRYLKDAQRILDDACKEYSELLPRVFASPERLFKDAVFNIELSNNEIQPLNSYELTIGSAKKEIFQVTKQKNDDNIFITLLVDRQKSEIPPKPVIKSQVSRALKEVIFGSLFRKPFIASAERTGAAIFRNDLFFLKKRILDAVEKMSNKGFDLLLLIKEVTSDYAFPVKDNVDFIRRLEDISKKESYISKRYENIIEEFNDIIGGEYRVKRDGLYYIPKSSRNIRLTMDASSSAVRSLLDLGFYLKHIAQPDDFLMIDEPELSLHPENQRRIARLLARLVNLGIKVFITTHSDYIIRELNTLIMLNNDSPNLKRICEERGYKQEELLSAEKVKVYVAKKHPVLLKGNKRKTRVPTLVPADIDPQFGIAVSSFDDTINELNDIQDEILFSGD